MKPILDNDAQLKALFSNKKLMQQMYSPESIKLMVNYFSQLEKVNNQNNNMNDKQHEPLEIMMKMFHGIAERNGLGPENLQLMNLIGYNAMNSQNDMNTIKTINNMNNMNNMNIKNMDMNQMNMINMMTMVYMMNKTKINKKIDYKKLYKNQLEELNRIGFTDEEANIAVL